MHSYLSWDLHERVRLLNMPEKKKKKHQRKYFTYFVVVVRPDHMVPSVHSETSSDCYPPISYPQRRCTGRGDPDLSDCTVT